jgi:hypothetical protein
MVHELDLRASLPVKHIPQPLMLCAPPSAAKLYIRGLPYNNLVDEFVAAIDCFAHFCTKCRIAKRRLGF